VGNAQAQDLGLHSNPSRWRRSGAPAILGSPDALEPHIALGPNDFEASEIFYEPLADIAADGTIVPVLATEVPSVDNGGVARMARGWSGGSAAYSR